VAKCTFVLKTVEIFPFIRNSYVKYRGCMMRDVGFSQQHCWRFNSSAMFTPFRPVNIYRLLKGCTLLCSWDDASQFYVNKCPTRCNCTQFILSVNCSTCFGWFVHPSGAQITVSTASGTSQLLLLPVAILHERLVLRIGFHPIRNTSQQQHRWTTPEAVVTVISLWWWAKTSPETCRAD